MNDIGSKDAENWKRIWNAKQADMARLQTNDAESVFMELKRLDGNDTLGNGGISYAAFRKQYEIMKRNFQGDKEPVKSVFEAGCGSGPFLYLLQSEDIQVGGMDYSEVHINAAKNVLVNPLELYCDEAIHLRTDIKYDCVFTNSMFEYFSNYDYAMKVLEKMCEKSNDTVAVLDVHDKEKEDEFIFYRRSMIDDYDAKYSGLRKLFFERDFFVDFAASHNMDIKITTSKYEEYWNREFVFDIYLYKNI